MEIEIAGILSLRKVCARAREHSIFAAECGIGAEDVGEAPFDTGVVHQNIAACTWWSIGCIGRQALYPCWGGKFRKCERERNAKREKGDGREKLFHRFKKWKEER